MSIKQEKGVPYKIPFNIKPKRSFELKQQRNNHSLPAINGAVKQQKVNAIRSQIDETRNQITVLKARINALKWEKNKHDKKQAKHNNQISFIHTVRDRLYEDRKYKQDVAYFLFQVNQKKQRELQYLKQQATSMRQKMMKEKQLAKAMLNGQKQSGAEEERQKRKQDQENIKRMKTIELIQNQLKAKNIKKLQLQTQEKLKQFYSSRVTFSKKNHHQKVERSLTQKEKLEEVLKKLKQQEEMMLQECKKSQAGMLSTLYELEGLNPERKRRSSIQNSLSTKNTALKQI